MAQKLRDFGRQERQKRLLQEIMDDTEDYDTNDPRKTYGHGNQARDHIYTTIKLTNNTSLPILGKGESIYSGSLIKNATKYSLAVIRFSIPGGTIPIGFWKQNLWKVSLTYNGFSRTIPVDYIPYANFSPNGTPQYTIYSYQAYADMINEALAECYTELIGDSGPIPDVTAAPFINYENTTNMFGLYAQEGYISANAKLYFNTALFSLFQNYLAYASTTTDFEWNIVLKNFNDLNTSITDSKIPTGYVKMSQEYPTLFNFNDIIGLNILSNTLGVAGNVYPVQNTTTTSTVVNAQTGSGPPTIPLLADFIGYYGQGQPEGVRGQNFFSSTGPWILQDLELDNINSIDIQIFMRDRQGIDHPYYLPAYETADVKFVFQKK